MCYCIGSACVIVYKLLLYNWRCVGISAEYIPGGILECNCYSGDAWAVFARSNDALITCHREQITVVTLTWTHDACLLLFGLSCDVSLAHLSQLHPLTVCLYSYDRGMAACLQVWLRICSYDWGMIACLQVWLCICSRVLADTRYTASIKKILFCIFFWSMRLDSLPVCIIRFVDY